MLCSAQLDTPYGKMVAAVSEKGLCLFDFMYRYTIEKIIANVEQSTGEKMTEAYHPLFDAVLQQIGEYHTGRRKNFDLPLHLAGTPFQVRVWEALLTIPYGETRTYEQQTRLLGDEKAIRAVASANGKNGIAIIVPCHRVIGKDGSLTGYGGGIARKKMLLELERKYSGLSNQVELF
jgi:O-6-methylguanine DNA methyltransferase